MRSTGLRRQTSTIFSERNRRLPTLSQAYRDRISSEAAALRQPSAQGHSAHSYRGYREFMVDPSRRPQRKANARSQESRNERDRNGSPCTSGTSNDREVSEINRPLASSPPKTGLSLVHDVCRDNAPRNKDVAGRRNVRSVADVRQGLSTPQCPITLPEDPRCRTSDSSNMVGTQLRQPRAQGHPTQTYRALGINVPRRQPVPTDHSFRQEPCVDTRSQHPRNKTSDIDPAAADQPCAQGHPTHAYRGYRTLLGDNPGPQRQRNAELGSSSQHRSCDETKADVTPCQNEHDRNGSPWISGTSKAREVPEIKRSLASSLPKARSNPVLDARNLRFAEDACPRIPNLEEPRCRTSLSSNAIGTRRRSDHRNDKREPSQGHPAQTYRGYKATITDTPIRQNPRNQEGQPPLRCHVTLNNVKGPNGMSSAICDQYQKVLEAALVASVKNALAKMSQPHVSRPRDIPESYTDHRCTCNDADDTCVAAQDTIVPQNTECQTCDDFEADDFSGPRSPDRRQERNDSNWSTETIDAQSLPEDPEFLGVSPPSARSSSFGTLDRLPYESDVEDDEFASKQSTPGRVREIYDNMGPVDLRRELLGYTSDSSFDYSVSYSDLSVGYSDYSESSSDLLESFSDLLESYTDLSEIDSDCY